MIPSLRGQTTSRGRKWAYVVPDNHPDLAPDILIWARRSINLVDDRKTRYRIASAVNAIQLFFRRINK